MHTENDARRTGARSERFRSPEAGLTLIEILVMMVIIVLVATIAVAHFQNYREKTRLVACMAEIRGIQAGVISMGDGRIIPTPQEFWESAWPDGRKHGPYYYIIDGDPNSGHGNDLDGLDEENPGKSWENRDKEDIKFVIFCDHDHGDLAKYVYLTDLGSPVLADDENDPNFQRFIKWEFGGPGAGNTGKGKKK